MEKFNLLKFTDYSESERGGKSKHRSAKDALALQP